MNQAYWKPDSQFLNWVRYLDCGPGQNGWHDVLNKLLYHLEPLTLKTIKSFFQKKKKSAKFQSIFNETIPCPYTENDINNILTSFAAAPSDHKVEVMKMIYEALGNESRAWLFNRATKFASKYAYFGGKMKAKSITDGEIGKIKKEEAARTKEEGSDKSSHLQTPQPSKSQLPESQSHCQT